MPRHGITTHFIKYLPDLISSLLPASYLLILCLVVGPVYAQSTPPRLSSLATGMMLVAAPGMRDPRFSRTVILLIQHSDRGSLGIIVNKQTEVKLTAAIPGLPAEHGDNHLLYFGGPVQPDRITYTYTGTASDASDHQVLSDVSWGSGIEGLVPMLERDASSLRVFFGYAGWGPGQLEFELSLNDWQLVPARASYIFSKRTETLWRLLNRETPELMTAISLPAWPFSSQVKTVALD